MMPMVDGTEVASAVRRDVALCDVPILFMTALVSEGDCADGAADSGGNTYLPKTAPMETLIGWIEKKLLRTRPGVPSREPEPYDTARPASA